MKYFEYVQVLIRIHDAYCGDLHITVGVSGYSVDCGTIDPCVLANIRLIEKRKREGERK